MRVIVLTILTLIAFAANSILARLALGTGSIDPISFTTVRLTSGALVLWLLAQTLGQSQAIKQTQATKSRVDIWIPGIALFIYALTFSLAYLSLAAGTGALILFGLVQITMLSVALLRGEQLRSRQWLGFAIAIIGLIYLLLPGISAPDPLGALLMSIAGMAWGVYSLRGKGTSDPIAMTARNFSRTVPLTCLASLIAISLLHLELQGVVLALISGIVTSGLGYSLWYKTLPLLTITQAAIVQLIVPAIAAFGGILFLAEQASLRLLLASVLILGGVGTTTWTRARK